MEYDWFFRGWQDSNLSTASPAYADLRNVQNKGGFGVRGALDITHKGRLFDVAFGPYFRYWRIEDSKINTSTGPVYIVTGYEPENTSLEVGGHLLLKF